jgi:GntR family transcriptional regulator, rspAB operon transcriptional repressor
MEENAAVAASLSEKAYILIRNKILKGEFALGAPLSRRRLAAEFEMSFLPISEAIRRLEADGLVESRPRVGTRVRIPTPQDVRDSYIIREALETQSARMFCERATPKERKELRSMASRLEEMVAVSGTENNDSDLQFSIQALHLQFHMRIAECTGCVPLYDLLEKNHLLIFNWFYDVSAGSKIAHGRHGALVWIITGDDPDVAALEMGRHVRSGMEEIQEAIMARFGKSVSISKRVSTGSGLGESSDGTPWRLRYASRTGTLEER